MIKTSKILAIVSLSSCLISLIGCQKRTKKYVDKDNIVFRHDDIVLTNFEGLGVEWGTYEDPDKLTADSWKRSSQAVEASPPQKAQSPAFVPPCVTPSHAPATSPSPAARTAAQG